MARTKSNPLAKGKTKAHRPPLRASPRLATWRSRGKVQPQLQAPDEKAPPGMVQNFHPDDPNGSPHYTVPRAKQHEKDGNLEADAEGALPAAEGGVEEILPKNDVYDALWAMLDTESENEAEEIPGQWDLDNVLNN
ncbi:hypothetical protein PIB30_069321 [Stylosanthes scabra]|uniref:Uncharacterized protein n=1 Tax=Stylosanthes scabra TaxID=79078 RepID=A0ABU6ZLV7_9FABA|nr:hypothetical protein [Stylosanthes scabra]